jgi:hypothetical protein
LTQLGHGPDQYSELNLLPFLVREPGRVAKC